MRGNPLSCEISKLGPPMVLHGSKKGSSWARVTRGESEPREKQDFSKQQELCWYQDSRRVNICTRHERNTVVLLPSKQRTFSLISNLLAPNDALQAAGLKGRWQGEEVSLDGTNSSL
ncbi:G polyprotein [Dissostichus eleginoides]|uniref:G polyprotein n=1 Tax=Dissostichus eleginoides TaxID=100907 RepID=A0AAD9BC39_DISEL|nr:G polyprotein [Dissostichus eleginoides]